MRRTSRPVIAAVLCCVLHAAAADTPVGTQWQHEDVAVFREKFLRIDRSFSPEARSAAEARLEKIERAAQPLKPAAFAVELCRIAALADNGHTQCLPGNVGKAVCERFSALVTDDSPWCHLVKPDAAITDFENVPISFHPFGSEFHVTGIDAKHEELLGARLIAVDGKPIESIRATLRTFAGGTVAHRDEVAASVLTQPQQLHVVEIADRENAVTYTFRLQREPAVERVLSLSIDAVKPARWKQLPAPEQAPWSYQELAKPFRFRDAPELDAVVVQLRQILDSQDEKISDFLERSERQRAKSGRRNVVLDLRANGGGNFLQAREFMMNWPTRVPGQFYVLTSRQTFSAAITSIAYLKQAGATRVKIVGEPAGDRLVFHSDGLPVQLPHSGLFFLPAVVRMDYENGCRQYDDCFEGIAPVGRPTATSLLKVPEDLPRIPVAVSSIEPDVFVPETIEAWLQGEDSAMTALIRLVGISEAGAP